MIDPLIEKLHEHLARKRLVPFLGADLPSTLTSLPSRSDLARDLCERHALTPGLSLAAATQRLLQGNNRFIFTDYLSRQLDSQNSPPAPYHQHIAALPVSHVITICYDDLLEAAYRRAGIIINRIVRDNDLPFADPGRPTLLKLYGDLSQRDTLVVTEDDQDSLTRNRDKENLLDDVRRLLRSNALIFLGHDLAAPAFKLLWRESLDRLGRFAIGAYAVCPGVSADEQRVWAERHMWVIDTEPLTLLEQLLSRVAEGTPDSTTPRSQPPVIRPAYPPVSPTDLIQDEAADLQIWLRQRAGALHEALVTFHPSGSPVDEYPISDPPPNVAIDVAALNQESLSIDDYGAALTQALFADRRLANALLIAQERARGANVPLRLRLQLDASDPALADVRWELLRDPHRDEFLCTSASTRFARYLASANANPVAPASLAPLTMLAAVAAPSNLAKDYGLPSINAEQELALIRSVAAGASLSELAHASLPSLADQLRAGPTVLYLVCHGALHHGTALLYLEDDARGVIPTPVERLLAMISSLAVRPRLVVLTACTSVGHSHTPGSALVALGPRLARAGVGAVLAMHDQIAMATIAAAMPVLFSELRAHGHIDRAVAAMRNVLATRGDDWWQPVLYLRLRNGLLFRPQ